MQKVSYVVWGLWLIVGIVLKIFGLVSWWVALSAIWFVAATIVASSFFIFITADIGKILKEKEERKIANTCKNCLFGQSIDILNDAKKEGEPKEKCIGEKLAGAERGKICQYYQRVKHN